MTDTKPKIGGKRPGAGRPRKLKGASGRSLYVSADLYDWLADMGAGNASAGLRKVQAVVEELQARLTQYERREQ